MPDKNEVERRTIAIGGGIEVRATDGDGPKGIRGRAAVVESVSEDLGGWTEDIAPGAFTEALKRSDIRGLFNHSPDMVLGRQGRTMRVWESDEGLEYEIKSLPSARADVLEMIERGDVDGNSFSFTVESDEWGTRDGKPHRTIRSFGELLDVGPVTFPAYPQTTVSARAKDKARSLQEEIAASQARDDEDVTDVEERLAAQALHIAKLERRLEILEVG